MDFVILINAWEIGMINFMIFDIQQCFQLLWWRRWWNICYSSLCKIINQLVKQNFRRMVSFLNVFIKITIFTILTLRYLCFLGFCFKLVWNLLWAFREKLYQETCGRVRIKPKSQIFSPTFSWTESKWDAVDSSMYVHWR